MQPIVKTGAALNSTAHNHLLDFPYYTIKCKLGQVLKDRGMTLKELSFLTGIRMATLSELANVKRTTLNVPHLLVIAKTLRMVDISELFEFVMPEGTYEQFMRDRENEIAKFGMLFDQQEALAKQREKVKKQIDEMEIIG